MQTTILIMRDFYNCSNLPIKAIDKNSKEIFKIGYGDELELIYFKNKVFNDVINFDFKSNFLKLSYPKDINFFITPISKLDNNKGFYIVGPFNSIENMSNIHISYRSNISINYLYELLINIHNDKFSKGRINLNYSSYIRKAINYSIKNYSSNISVDAICNQLNINKSYFCKIFKDETGYTFCNFLNTFRVEKSKDLLRNTDMSLLDIAVNVGFNSQNYYTMVFKKTTGETPIKYRNR